MRKRTFMICFILILIVCAVLVIGGCGAHQAVPPEVSGGDGADVVTASSDDDNITDADAEDPDGSNASDVTDEPADSGEKPAADEPDDEDAPSRGDDRSIRGIPDAVDTRSSDDGDLLVVVNKYHAVSKNYKPKDLVTIDDRYGTWKNMELKSEAYEAYKKLYKDAAAQGFELKLCSAMRTYETQKTLYTNAVKNKGRETANIRSAYPGRSEHHTGLAIDVTSASMGWGLTQDFADYPDGQWINEHCQEYGFIIRYPKGKTDITGYAYEPWHLRYVGVDAATYIMENGLTLEEYMGV
ncbi:MAG: D-alanyl-D-alanine carboxypeptidase family protein [Anaerovoracaceae bacterium]